LLPICGPNPNFVVIDGQALVCTDPDDANPASHEEEVPVVDIAASVLCVLHSAQLRAAISKVLCSAVALTAAQTLLLDAWHKTISTNDRTSVETAAARIFLHFFPFDTTTSGTSVEASGAHGGQARPSAKACSPICMQDESLGATAGVATQAAEVSHSIAVASRTSLAYMKPATYMTHKMVQVAMMNIRKLQRLASANPKSENDHIPLAPFFHSQLARQCELGSTCLCQSSIADDGRRETEQTSAVNLGQLMRSANADTWPQSGSTRSSADPPPSRVPTLVPHQPRQERR